MASDDKLAMMEKEINALHACLEKRGINSRGTTDIFGRPFSLPVNAEHKATVFTVETLLSCAQPHMRTFWAATFGFFCTFFSVFAPAALGYMIKKSKWDADTQTGDGGLNLDKDALSLAGNLAVSGTVVMRVIAGPMCDLWGARKTFILLLLVAIPGMVILMTAQGEAAYILGRFIIGLSLATFVTCQVWCSQFFERRIIGTVNATAGGWGNVGGGVTLLLMPQIAESVKSWQLGQGKQPGEAIDFTWRFIILVPMLMHIVAALFIMTGRDLADGSYSELETSGAKQKSKGAASGSFELVKVGFSNTNALVLMLGYALCFGVELTMNNKLVGYFDNYYAKPPRTAGVMGASFSLMNLFARSWGGMLSDTVAIKFGLRGRITAMWLIQTLEGMLCIFLGMVTINMKNPDSHEFKPDALAAAGMHPTVKAVWVDDSGLDPMTYTFTGPKGNLSHCASDYVFAPEWPCDEDVGIGCAVLNGVISRLPTKEREITILDPNMDCIHNGDSIGATMICIIGFSILVQMSEGLHFGIVPFVSRPALGVVSGMVGAGGNIGAVISGQFIIGSGKKEPLDQGFIYLGIIIMCLALTMHFIFFPGEGGILLPANFPYDPQWIKPTEGAVGSDELNFENVKSSTKEEATKASSV